MEDLSGFTDLSKRNLSFMQSLVEHLLWVLSRALLVLLIVMVAYFLQTPVQKLLERDAFSEWEKSQKAEVQRRLDIVDTVTVASNKIDVSFADSIREIRAYLQSTGARDRGRAQTKIRATAASVEELRATFSARKALLSSSIESDILELAWVSDQGVRAMSDIVESKGSSSLDAYSILIHKYVSNINEYKADLLNSGKQGASSILKRE